MASFYARSLSTGFALAPSRGARRIFCREGAKPGTIAPTFFYYVWMPCCIPDPTVIEKVAAPLLDFRLQCYETANKILNEL